MAKWSLRAAARAELDESRPWLDDDSNFAPLLPLALAETLRAPLYAGAIAIVLLGLGRLLGVELGALWRALPWFGLMALVWFVVELLDPREPWSYAIWDALAGRRPLYDKFAPPAPASYHRPAEGDTIPLAEVRHE